MRVEESDDESVKTGSSGLFRSQDSPAGLPLITMDPYDDDVFY